MAADPGPIPADRPHHRTARHDRRAGRAARALASGEGQAIEVCLADTAYTTVEIPVSTYLGSGEETPRDGNRYGSGNMYPTTDGHVYIASYTSDKHLPPVRQSLGPPRVGCGPHAFIKGRSRRHLRPESNRFWPSGSRRRLQKRPRTRWAKRVYRVHPSTTSGPRRPTLT